MRKSLLSLQLSDPNFLTTHDQDEIVLVHSGQKLHLSLLEFQHQGFVKETIQMRKIDYGSIQTFLINLLEWITNILSFLIGRPSQTPSSHFAHIHSASSSLAQHKGQAKTSHNRIQPQARRTLSSPYSSNCETRIQERGKVVRLSNCKRARRTYQKFSLLTQWDSIILSDSSEPPTSNPMVMSFGYNPFCGNSS
ncbi:hypothetical protein O181_031554 [Austropuccinia psidii MF-1]|uniref:Uncharacterized protein n=1 Tax=Austropuccinia psidii MF-1 TaxID=1389203 RepID=A0A9Q3CVY2_9BASI|nr:hypothetical protein [Austropuccinia psidii MF-1]